jgi:hypothetical protein
MQMLEKNEELAAVQAAAAVLTKVFRNVLSEPSNERFRRLKKDNKQVASKVMVVRGAPSLLRAVGFQPDPEDKNVLLLLPPPPSSLHDADADDDNDAKGRLEYALIAVGGLAEAKAAQLAQKTAAEREARLAAVRRETAAKKAAMQRLRSEAEADKIARKDPSWAAKGFEKNGRDVGRLTSD